MAGLLAVVVTMGLAIAMSIAYVLVLRELRRINASLDQLIADARNNKADKDEAPPLAPRYVPQSFSIGRYSDGWRRTNS